MAKAITLYKNHKRSIGYWRIWVEFNIVYYEWAITIGGEQQFKTEVIEKGKQGRTIDEQARFCARSKIQSKLDAGYVTSIEEAKAGPPTDAEGKIKPMNAQLIDDYKKSIDENNAFVQLKYNGHRCLITKKDGEVFAYSRNGKSMPGIPHILAKIHIYEGQILDGELYRHGWPLQRIASAAKKLQSNSRQLKFVCYDTVAKIQFIDRFTSLKDYDLGDGVILAPTKRRSEIEDLFAVFKIAKEKGYEGLMLRHGDSPYDQGRRSCYLLKIKKMNGFGYIDDEFTVIDIVPSKDGWGILICQLPNGGTVRASAPGPIPMKVATFRNKEKYIGQQVKLEFPEYTNDDVPFQPVALGWMKNLEV